MNRKQFIFSCSILFFTLLLGKPTLGQLTPVSEQNIKALNNYMRYSNEVSYACSLLFRDFKQVNDQFYLVATDSIDTAVFDKKTVLTNKNLFPVLPRDLYSITLQDNRYLPYQKRGTPLQLIGKINNVLQEISTTRNNLENYIITNTYKSDKHLEQGFAWLRRIEVLYYDIFTLQEKLHWNLHALLSSYYLDSSPQIKLIERLQQVLKQNKLIIKSVRANDNSSLLKDHSQELSILLASSKLSESMLASLSQSEKQACEVILKKSRTCLEQSQYFSQKNEYKNLEHLPHYYYYNERFLPLVNRSDAGMARLFNQLIESQKITWLLEQELPPLFEVVYPNLPIFEAYQTPDIDVDELIQKALLAKAQKDSLNELKEQISKAVLKDSIIVAQEQADSLNPLKKEAKRGLPNLNGFASNNLVFLLDISASMSDSNKLPLLKTALRQLLDLMRPEDNITFITYSGRAKVVLDPTSAQYKKRILQAIDHLNSGGVSDADQGLELAYQTLQKNIISAGNNRIILATDGAIKVKNSTKKLIRKGSKEKDAICLSVFYFSQKEFRHHKELLEELSLNGRGKYSYIQKENAEKILLLEAQAVRTKK